MFRRVLIGVVFASLIPATVFAADPVKSPSRGADKTTEENTEKSKEKKEAGAEEATEETKKKEKETVGVPAVRVKGQKEQPKANDPVGSYEQPRWTVRRPFSMSRVYVNPSGYSEFNLFFTPQFTFPEEGDNEISYSTEYEFEVGLSKRLQFDAYLVTAQPEGSGSFGVVEEKLELRWAFADWGEIWGNPTLYVEWAHAHNAAPSIEPKLLLGGNLSESLFGSLNLVYERPIGAEGTKNEFGLSGGLAYLLDDPNWFVGADMETELEFESEGEEEKMEVGGVLGPSVQWYPSEPVHVGLSAMGGAVYEQETEDDETETKTEPLVRTRLILGYEF